jgi:hypothetical protein
MGNFLQSYLILYRGELKCLLLSETSTLFYYLHARLEPTRVKQGSALKYLTRVEVTDRHSYLQLYGVHNCRKKLYSIGLPDFH